MSGICLEGKGSNSLRPPLPSNSESTRAAAQQSSGPGRVEMLDLDPWMKACTDAFSKEPRFSGLRLDINVGPEARAMLPKVPFSKVFKQMGGNQNSDVLKILSAYSRVPDDAHVTISHSDNGPSVFEAEITNSRGQNMYHVEIAFRVENNTLFADGHRFEMLETKAGRVSKELSMLAQNMEDHSGNKLFQGLTFLVSH